MRILIAPDAFKGSLTARQASRAISNGILKALPGAEVVLSPLADGGEGTADIVRPYLDKGSCLIESARHIGICLPEMKSRPVMHRGSAALAEALLQALDRGERHFMIALGGSATNDAGLGMLMALGLQAVDQDGKGVEPTLAGLLKLSRIDISSMDRRLAECSFTILADVMSPLCGKEGATSLYGLQKGISAADVGAIDEAVAKFAGLCAGSFGFDPGKQEGAGAAGGLGFALMLLGGKVLSGADYVIHASGLKERLAEAEWVVTGEGCSDLQTLEGKLPCKVALAAKEAGVNVALLSGSIDKRVQNELSKYFDMMLEAQSGDIPTEVAMKQAASLLTAAASCLAREIHRNDSVS